MPITEILERNAQLYKDDVALVEINPQELEKRHTTWREYSLMEPSPTDSFRSELTWGEFDRKANRVANFLPTTTCSWRHSASTPDTASGAGQPSAPRVHTAIPGGILKKSQT